MASEAELISVLDRVLDCFPGLREREWEFRISHSSGALTHVIVWTEDDID
jgi:hypothetical protein